MRHYFRWKKKVKRTKKAYRKRKIAHLRRVRPRNKKNYFTVDSIKRTKVFKLEPRTVKRPRRKRPFWYYISRRALWSKQYQRKKRLKNPKKIKQLTLLRKTYPLIRHCHIYIRLRRINTFLTAMTQKKKTLLTLSTGTLKYSGRKKGSPFARESLTIKFARILLQKHYRFVDITFVSKKGKFYRVIFKAFITARLIIRMIRIAKIHSHGFIRPKKAKRK